MTEGVLPVDKPAGPTSHDVVQAARRTLGVRRIGHTGTLDPFASGLLLLCVGASTRIAEYLLALDKTYEAVARLGVVTDTDDSEGAVVAEAEPGRLASLKRGRVDNALAALRGTIRQVPPRYSAKKLRGVPMHRRARRGEDVVAEPHTVTVHELELTAWDPPSCGLRVRCSSGTYVRALARDLGEALGVGAHLTALRRTAIGSFAVEAALPPAALEDPARVAEALIDPVRALAHLPLVHVGDAEARRLMHGQRVALEGMEAHGTVVVSREGALLAIAEGEGGVLVPSKVFAHG